jgi:hypothetical protein
MAETDEMNSYDHMIVAPPHIIDLAEKIITGLLDSYPIEELMKMVKENSTDSVYIITSKRNPEKVRVIVDSSGKFKYCCQDPLFIPLPKKFAVLEPDKNYFERTLRANVFLTLMEASEIDLHR